MIETVQDSRTSPVSPRRVLWALAVAGVVLVVAYVAVLQLGSTCAARHAPLKDAVQLELELVRANLGYERVVKGDADADRSQVDLYLVRAEWYAQQMMRVCSAEQGRFFIAPIAPLRSRLEVLLYELQEFKKLTRARWQTIDPQSGTIEPDPAYDLAFRELALRSRETIAAADRVVQVEQGVLATMQAVLVISVLILAGFVAMVLLRYLDQLRKIQRSLDECRSRFECLLRDSSDAIVLLDESNFYDCNEATLRIFQLETYKDLRRKHPADLSPPRQPDGSDSMTLANQRIAAAHREGTQRFEWIHRRADGTDFPTEVLLSRVQLEGRQMLQAVIRDVTLHHESEARSRSNEAKLHTISDAALDAVIMMDERGRAIHWNPAAQKMFGYAPADVLGQDIHQLLAPGRLQETAAQALDQFRRTGQGRAVGRTLELQAVRQNAEEFPIEISLAPIQISGHWCAVAVIRDITDRKLADEKLRAEQRTLRRLLKSHDQERKLVAYEIHDGLAQELVAAIMHCQAQAASTQDANTRQLIEKLLELLQQCLSETRRLISGLRPPVLDEYGVITALDGLLEETRANCGPEVEFYTNLEVDRFEPVLETTIFRVIQESLGNACRHSQSPRVRIDLIQLADQIRIQVQDWGIGFDPQQVDRNRYGLAGIRERARLLGGDALVDSKPGAGTTITVHLPTDVGDLVD